ncbi:hypothetical protein [Aromatoleum evansii]|uniref:hypothetical protein n=1 Tax=Aromatoleum evansii TaxID=59406 RepID=UPI00145E281B|nr:hypothetical protein [Aromatoleum evansii]NMG28446.1 hypothetical protein [Aromatoleum evansii]
MKFVIDPRLAHLGEADLAVLAERYFAGDRAGDLVQEFRLQCSPNQLYRLVPPRLLADHRCEACGAPLIQMRRVGVALSHGMDAIRCSACHHRVKGACRCDACQAKKRQQAHAEVTREHKAREAYCKGQWSYGEVQCNPEDLSVDNAVALLALVRCGGWVSDTVIGRIDASGIPFAPEGLIGGHLVAALISSGLIAPALDSPIDAFETTRTPMQAFMDRVHWRILAVSPMLLVQRLEELCQFGEWPAAWYNGLPELQLALAVAECREFADLCLTERGLPAAGHLAAEALFKNLLTDFSVSQCFRIIWSGAMASIDFIARTNSSRRHGTNYFIGACQRWADRARAEGRTIKSGFRNGRRPRSQLSYVLYDVFLGVGEMGFSEPLRASP